jgi:hypothetical protein
MPRESCREGRWREGAGPLGEGLDESRSANRPIQDHLTYTQPRPLRNREARASDGRACMARVADGDGPRNGAASGDLDLASVRHAICEHGDLIEPDQGSLERAAETSSAAVERRVARARNIGLLPASRRHGTCRPHARPLSRGDTGKGGCQRRRVEVGHRGAPARQRLELALRRVAPARPFFRTRPRRLLLDRRSASSRRIRPDRERRRRAPQASSGNCGAIERSHANASSRSRDASLAPEARRSGEPPSHEHSCRI